ncbi:MAG: hypothetical protein JWR62_2000 [Modestobacter sp.]|jgi:hypothetical protein|nr:hypothetical protein [Modestobacter sp.]
MSTTSDEEIDDPGRDPKGLSVPRNPLGGADQDSGQGAPRGDDGDAPGDHDAAAGGAAQP